MNHTLSNLPGTEAPRVGTQAERPGRLQVDKLHHFAWRCRDAEETRHFYEDLLGLPLVHVIKADHVPSTGEYCPYVHVFFEMHDGSSIAFFDLGDDVAALPSPNTPSWVNHIALEVASMSMLHEAARRLRDAGHEVVGVTDHGFVRSIYTFDPNGLRLELTTPTAEPGFAERSRAEAAQLCRDWTLEKQARRAVSPAIASSASTTTKEISR